MTLPMSFRISTKAPTTTGHMVKLRLPEANFELEDALISQLPVNDVLNNCVSTSTEHSGSSWSVDKLSISPKSTTRRRHRRPALVYHRCYCDTLLNPLWLVFGAFDVKTCGKVIASRIMPVTSSILKEVLEDDDDYGNHKHLHQDASGQITFAKYQRHVTEKMTSRARVDGDLLAALSWNACKHRYLSPPYIDPESPHSPPDVKRQEAVFWLFCVFCKLAEPGIYPPSVDYEEGELLVRKVTACMGVRWSNSPDLSNTSSSSDDNHSTRTDDSGGCLDSIGTLQITFQQLLSILADIVGSDVIATSSFHQAMKWLCLTECQATMKTGWLQVRKAGGDTWRKRWTVLQGNSLNYYVTSACGVAKERLLLTGNMRIEALPGSKARKNRFRIVEKDGDMSIKREDEFVVTDANSAHSWITLCSISMRLHYTGMSAKCGEISERRLERHRRRESVYDVRVKKRDLQRVHQTLETIRKERREFEQQMAESARRRREQLRTLDQMDRVYDRLDRLHDRDRSVRRVEIGHALRRLEVETERGLSPSKEEVSSLCNWDLSASGDLIEERASLERKLEVLRLSSCFIPPTPDHVTTSSLVRPPPPYTSHATVNLPTFDYRSSSDNLSTGSTDPSLRTSPPDTDSWI